MSGCEFGGVWLESTSHDGYNEPKPAAETKRSLLENETSRAIFASIVLHTEADPVLKAYYEPQPG